MNKSWKISLGCGLFAFGVTLALLKIASLGDRTERLGKGAVRESQGDILAPSERARSHREFVMNILQTRRSQPLRAPEEWMQFVASLDAWYRAAQSDCIATLTSNSFNAILRLVEEPRENMTTEELFSIARETSESKTRFACWEEVWKRTSEQGPERSAELLASMPAIYRPVFRDRLLKSWVKAKGIQSLEQIAASQFTSALDFDYAFRLCAEVDPEQCVKYLEKADYHKLQERFGSSLRTREGLLFDSCLKLPPARALDLLSNEPPSVVRDSQIGNIVFDAVRANPTLAESLVAKHPHALTEACLAAGDIAESNPRSAAGVINLVPGEQLRTSVARKTALKLSPAKADEFIQALSEPLTQATVRAAVDQLRKAKPSHNPKE